MLGAIKYNLGNLTTFTGRDGRSTFWFYVLFLVIAQFLVGLVISLPMLGGAAQEAFHAASEGASDIELQQRMMATMGASMRTSMLLSAGVALICALMLVASFVRRLHDSGRPGWIAAIPFLLVLAGQASTMANMEAVLEAMAGAETANPAAALKAQQPLLLAGAMTWVGYLTVIVFGAWPSSDGDNSYGAEPEHI